MRDMIMLDSIKIVLVETSHPGNIGATARAMKTMGLKNLVLVQPKYFPHPEATAMASGADDILEQAKVVNCFSEAIADCHFVYGCTARARDLEWPMLLPRELSEQSYQNLQNGLNIAIVFGRERTGLTNEELWLCHAGVHIPTSPVYRSLNVAQAVQIICYELYQGQANTAFHSLSSDVVSSSAMQQFYQHLEQVLIDIQFMRADEPKRLLPKLRRLFNRCQIQASEMNILRGILTQVQKYGKGHD
jgi:tRNA (cytidine32/uridine32-2'-O)-methyltransferase